MIKMTSDRLKVWKNTKDDKHYFTYSISNKKQDGTYEYMSKKIRFMKDKEPKDSCEIMIKDAFQSFYVADDKRVDYLMVMDYDVISGPTSDTTNEISVDDDDLPF